MHDTHWLHLDAKSWETVVGGSDTGETWCFIQASCAVRMGDTKYFIEGIPEHLENCAASVSIWSSFVNEPPLKIEVLGDVEDPPDPIGGIMQSASKDAKLPFGVANLYDGYGSNDFFDIRLYPGQAIFDDLRDTMRQGGAMPTKFSLTIIGVKFDEDLNLIWDKKTNHGWRPVSDFRLISKLKILDND